MSLKLFLILLSIKDKLSGSIEVGALTEALRPIFSIEFLTISSLEPNQTSCVNLAKFAYQFQTVFNPS